MEDHAHTQATIFRTLASRATEAFPEIYLVHGFFWSSCRPLLLNGVLLTFLFISEVRMPFYPFEFGLS